MRNAEKYLLCSAAIYTAERTASILANSLALAWWRTNIFMYVFAVLAIYEYVKLIRKNKFFENGK